MTTPLPKRFEPFQLPGGLRGQLTQLALPDILQHLRLTNATGVLSLVSGGARKALYLRGGRVVFASSNLPDNLKGDALNTSLYGLAGDDTLTGRDGDDYLDAGDGTGDTIIGGNGTDTCLNGEFNTSCP